MTKHNKKQPIEAQERDMPKCPETPDAPREQFQAWRAWNKQVYETRFGTHSEADYRQSLHVMPGEGEQK